MRQPADPRERALMLWGEHCEARRLIVGLKLRDIPA
jgi:hypothetical protein